MVVRLNVFGEARWETGGSTAPIQGSIRLGVLLLLAEHQGQPVPVSRLLDRLWDRRPASGPNAVQRHISALRSQLKGMGVAGEQIIQTAPGGYRLSSLVVTDATELEKLLDGRPSALGIAEIKWRAEPFQGHHSRANDFYRSRLEQLAERAFDSWVASAAPTQVAQRASSMLIHMPDSKTLLDSYHQARASQHEAEHFSSAARDFLRRCVGLWFEGRADDALDLLESAHEVLPRDFARRLCRWMIWLEPADATAHYMMSLIAKECVAAPEQFERTIAALDGRSFSHMTDGRRAAATETSVATSPAARLRSLRAEYLHGLTRPHDDHQDRIADQIDALGIRDAFVEAERFRFLAQVRLGRFPEADAQLQRYEQCVETHWPLAGDDFAPMARSALRRSLDPTVKAIFGEPEPCIPGAYFADRKLVPLATAIGRLIVNSPTEPLTDREFHEGLSAISPTSVAAMRLLRRMNGGRPIRDQAHELAAALELAPQDGQFHLLPISIGLAGEAIGDRQLAKAAAHALSPWAGQYLGLWPIDFLFGPADDWIARFDSVS